MASDADVIILCIISLSWMDSMTFGYKVRMTLSTTNISHETLTGFNMFNDCHRHLQPHAAPLQNMESLDKL